MSHSRWKPNESNPLCDNCQAVVSRHIIHEDGILCNSDDVAEYDARIARRDADRERSDLADPYASDFGRFCL
jgi:hypothetical protein